MFHFMKKQDNEGMRTYATVLTREKGMGPGSAGQSGDTQGLSDVAEAGTESVEELIEEGQYFEANVISGVEDAQTQTWLKFTRQSRGGRCACQISGERPVGLEAYHQ